MDGATEEEDFSGIPIKERLDHKVLRLRIFLLRSCAINRRSRSIHYLLQVWKARVSAYEELAKKFRLADPADAREFTQYDGCLKKMAVDANAVAQESGLTTLINYVENAPNAARTRETVIPAVVEKCFGSTRAGTKAKALELILMYIEIDVADPVVVSGTACYFYVTSTALWFKPLFEFILPGLDAKQPKLVAQTVLTLKEITVSPKPILKHLAKIFGHVDKNVRTEATALTMEVHRWLGAALSSYLSELKPVQVKELEEGFAKLPADKPVAARLLRSQVAAAVDAEQGND
ncbi:hypothetical protein BC936DRAFT_138746 [Jimgerdemannia flammicorona]|uniref:TOG domain-containing protein n=1 Tax=Jimgerdemannia flammicorona TaxID=994334 RepID=A0A433BLN6_9FUNG|nr:hypothetical protein BC936DRAFT_138746 [Jimgerdemannia flammicorona]